MIKRFFLSLIALASITPMFADGILFENLTLPEAQDKASKEGKMVFVDCYIPSCGPCKYMAKNIFPLDSCGEFMNPRFVSVMKDLEADDNRYIVDKYNVRIYPTFLLLRPDGSLFYKVEGGAVRQAGKFISRIQETLRLGELNERYDNGERDMSFMAGYVGALRNFDMMSMRKVLDKYIPSLSTAEMSSPLVAEMVSHMMTTESEAFNCLFNHSGEILAQADGSSVMEALVSVYAREFENKKTLYTTDFTSRASQLAMLEKEGVTLPLFLREKMIIRDVINKKDCTRLGEITAMIESIGRAEAAEPDKVNALRELRGFTQLTSAIGDMHTAEVLKNVLSTLSESSSRELRGTLGAF